MPSVVAVEQTRTLKVARSYGLRSENANIDPRLVAAMHEVQVSSSILTSVTKKAKTLRKFGAKTIGTSRATIAPLGGELNETYVSTNVIDRIVSSSTSDTAKTVNIEYHTISGGNFTFGVQSATLTGQAPVTLATPCARVSRIYNTGATELVGNVYVYEDGTITTPANGPDDATTIHAQIPAGDQSTHKASTTLSSVDYMFITEAGAAVVDAAPGVGGTYIDIDLEIRNAGGVFRKVIEWGVSSDGLNTAVLQFDPVIIVPANSDIRIRALSSKADIDVTAFFSGYLASVI